MFCHIRATHRKLLIDLLRYSNRLCFGLWQEKLVKWLAIACTVTYIAVFLTITFGCWPYASIVYHFHDICEAHLAAAFQTTGGSTLHHLVRCSLISRIVEKFRLFTWSSRTLRFKGAERYCHLCLKCDVRI
jgi:hypothetical protein